MKPSRTQLDASEARHLKEWRTLVRHRRHVRIELAAKRPFVVADTLKRCDEAREQVAIAIRAIRAQRKALEAECNGWQLVHANELAALRASQEFACVTPDEDCECSGCMAFAESEREMT